jgi:hypothetical protein
MDRIERIRSHLTLTHANVEAPSGLDPLDTLASTAGDASMFDDTDDGRNAATHWNGWGYAVRLFTLVSSIIIVGLTCE